MSYPICAYNGCRGCGECCPPQPETRSPSQIESDRETCGRNGCMGCGRCLPRAPPPAAPARERDARQDRRDRQYRELRAADPDLFRKCVQYAEGVVFNNHRELSSITDVQRVKLAADIEAAMIALAMEIRQ